MAEENQIKDAKKYDKWIVILSIVIPVVVAVLFRVKIDAEYDEDFEVEGRKMQSSASE